MDLIFEFGAELEPGVIVEQYCVSTRCAVLDVLVTRGDVISGQIDKCHWGAVL